MLGAKREAANDLRIFHIIQHAMHADKNEAQKFVAKLEAMAE
jgi:hypothetical protein